MEETSLLYQFLVGGILFTIGIVVPWRAGDYSWKKPGDRKLLYSMLVACFFYLIMQTAWHLYAAWGG